jgi:hypothetical protein
MRGNNEFAAMTSRDHTDRPLNSRHYAANAGKKK